jgi:signal transduction histidine kinase
MLDDSNRLLATIEQILRTGRIGASARSLNLSRVEMRSLVENCIARARTLHGVGEDGLHYQQGDPVSFIADEEEVRAAVFNLIDNAIKYSGTNVHVAVEVGRERDRVAVRVRDQGAGIPKSELKHIFKRFYRISGPQASRVKGTGLGLYIVRSVAKRHHGRAWAESEGPGRGSTFVLEFPVAR